MRNMHRNIERTYRDRKGHTVYMVIRDTKDMTMELHYLPADGRESQLIQSIKWRPYNSDGPEMLETKACRYLTMIATNLARMSDEQAANFIRETQLAEGAETCERCRRRGRGDRPNPGYDNPNYVWYFGGEDQTEQPEGWYHARCHKLARIASGLEAPDGATAR